VLDEESFCEGLRGAAERDEIGDLLLRYASRLLTRICLFSVHRNRVAGWMARGQVAVDDVQSLVIPLDVPSVFRNLELAAGPYVGPVPPGAVNDKLIRPLGQLAPMEVVLIPLRVKERTVAYLLGDVADSAVAVPVQELVSAVNKAGIAFEILIQKSKIQVGPLHA
jgi:hypothetical protein